MSERRAKLVCTIGPASIDRVDELVAAGMDVARINFSHGSPMQHARAAERVRDAADRTRRVVAILVDLSGPKIRLGDLDADVELAPGATFDLHPAPWPHGGPEGAQVSRALEDELEPGDRILLADGAAELRVTSTDALVHTEVVRGGRIRSHAGVNVPAGRLSGPGLTEQDRADIPRALKLNADYVAQSFVRRASDVADLRELLGPGGPPIVAKVETRPAIDDFDAICEAADAVMIARGDLGVELPFEEVPILQKQLVRRALDRGIPTIVATQMLESMTTSPRPTRAEASDVANAIFDGADAIMLSGETAIGQHPVLAAEAAVRIAQLCATRGGELLPAGAPATTGSDAAVLAYAASAIATAEREVTAIACYTRTGKTARAIAAHRPRVPILAFSPDAAVVRRLALVHGVEPRPCLPPPDTGARLSLMAWLLGEETSLAAGSAVVLVASTATPGTGPNLLEIHRIPGSDERQSPR
ncbi:MAG TPA: pyruvate kinase [Candidatus Limnocylindria bacterium]